MADSKQGDREWRPDDAIQYAPLFDPSAWSLSAFLKYFFSYPGYFAPWNLVYYAVCAASHQFTTPSLSDCTSFRADWLARLFLRNEALCWLFYGGWHGYLYWPCYSQGKRDKYDKAWPAKHKKFLFGDQTLENVFMSCVPGVLIWTAYEALFLRMWAKGRIPSMYGNWRERPWWSLVQLVCIPFWREFHFYWIHRFIHWGPMYRMVHYFHHKNVNPGPWSGLSMHPLEQLMYLSVVWPHMFISGTPLHFFFNAQHTALTPAGGHSGFHGPLHGGSYFHYLHHRYFECNYGEATIPLDRWFGTFRDGKNAGLGTATEGGKSKDSAIMKATTVSMGLLCGLLPLFPLLKQGLRD